MTSCRLPTKSVFVLFFVIALLFIASCFSIHNLAAFVACFGATLRLLVVLGHEHFEHQTTTDKHDDEDDQSRQKTYGKVSECLGIDRCVRGCGASIATLLVITWIICCNIEKILRLIHTVRLHKRTVNTFN